MDRPSGDQYTQIPANADHHLRLLRCSPGFQLELVLQMQQSAEGQR